MRIPLASKQTRAPCFPAVLSQLSLKNAVKASEPKKASAAGARKRPACEPQRPQIRIGLDSWDDLLAAKASVKFCYTGEVEGDSVQLVLQTAQQGQFLQVTGLAAACCDRLQALLQQAKTDRGDGAGASAQAASGGAAGEETAPEKAALELFSLQALWPDKADVPGG